MTGYSHLATLILLAAFVKGFWCRTWPNLEYYNMDSFGWEMSLITGVNSLDFVDNFMIPMRHDPKQIMVGNANGYSPSSGEGCIQIYYLRNRTKSVRKIAGKCSRHIEPCCFRYKDGYGLGAEIKWPDHGYMTKNRQWVLFVDDERCARKLSTTTFHVATVIGHCHYGFNHGSHGTNRKTLGMVYLDEKNLWVFFMLSGMYIYPWGSQDWRKLNDRESMGKYHYVSDEPGLITKSTHDPFLVFQKVAYGVTTYDFTNVSMEGSVDASSRRLFSLKRWWPWSDQDAQYKYSLNSRNFEMTYSNGHVSQHPYYKELLMVTDMLLGSIFLLNTDNGKVRQYCKRATGSVYIVTTSNEPDCRFTSLKSTMWVGGSALSALVVDRTAWLIHQIMLTNNMEQRHNRCVKCLDGPGSPTCYDTRDGAICVCAHGYEGPYCDTLICDPSRCYDHGQCTTDVTNRVICHCYDGWRGARCSIQRNFALHLVNNTAMNFEIEPGTSYNIRVGSGFLLKKLGDPSMLIVGIRPWSVTNKEGAIGYYRLGRMSHFVYLAGNLVRARGPNKFNDGNGTDAHMLIPLFAYQQKDGKWLHFVDTWSCARRLKLTEQLQVLTWIGAGRCGNGTLDLARFGTKKEVRGMTMMEFSNNNYFLFSGSFGVYLTSWTGSVRKWAAGARATSAYLDRIYGSLTKKSANSHMVYHNTPYGITRYNFYHVSAHNQNYPQIKRIASLKPFTAKMNQNSDTGATHNYDNNQAGGFGGAGGVIEINPSIPNLIMVADEAKDSVILYDMTTGNLLAVCSKDVTTMVTPNIGTCKWSMLKSAMWLTATTAVVSDYYQPGQIYVLNFRVGADGCASGPCGSNGICSDKWQGNGFECLCHNDWSGSTCSTYSPRSGAVFPVLGPFVRTGHQMSVGASRSETFSMFTFTASLTSCYLHLSDS